MHAYSHDSSRFIHFCIPQLTANLSLLMLSCLELRVVPPSICTHDSPLQMRYRMHSAIRHVTRPQCGGGVRTFREQHAVSWSANRKQKKRQGDAATQIKRRAVCAAAIRQAW